METNTFSLLSPLPTLRVLSSENLTPTTCYIVRSQNHFLKHFSSTTNLKLRTPQAIINPSPIAPSEEDGRDWICNAYRYPESLPYLFSGRDCILHAQEVRKGGGYLLVATDIAARGVDLPEMSHIYNFDLPRTAIHYLHRAG